MASAFYSLLRSFEAEPKREQQQQQDGWCRMYIHSVLYVREGVNRAPGNAADDIAAAAAAATAAAEAAERDRMLQEYEQWQQQQRRPADEETDDLGGIFSFFGEENGEPEESLLSFFDEWY